MTECCLLYRMQSRGGFYKDGNRCCRVKFELFLAYIFVISSSEGVRGWVEGRVPWGGGPTPHGRKMSAISFEFEI
jgi:hypothetical protein